MKTTLLLVALWACGACAAPKAIVGAYRATCVHYNKPV
jgi:hypothetical protein